MLCKYLRDNYGLYSNDFINMFNSGRKMITVKVNLYSILNSTQPPKKKEIQFAPYHCTDRVFKALIRTFKSYIFKKKHYNLKSADLLIRKVY